MLTVQKYIVAYFFKQSLVNNYKKNDRSSSYILLRHMCQAYVCMCKVLMHIYFYSHLHATLGAFYVHFVVNIYLSGTSHIHVCQLELWFYIHVHVATH